MMQVSFSTLQVVLRRCLRVGTVSIRNGIDRWPRRARLMRIAPVGRATKIKFTNLLRVPLGKRFGNRLPRFWTLSMVFD